jgi:flagellar biosynthesis/type III secretory pathway protein FliH
MSRDTAIDRIRNAKSGKAGAQAMGKLGRDIGAAYDQAAAAAEQAYLEAQDAYHDAIHTAEQAYADARAAAEDAYAEGQHQADALREQSAHLYEEAIKRGRAYGKRAARFTGDNKALALVLAAGVGFVLAKALHGRT